MLELGLELTLHPSHSFLTELRTFMPRVCCCCCCCWNGDIDSGSDRARVSAVGMKRARTGVICVHVRGIIVLVCVEHARLATQRDVGGVGRVCRGLRRGVRR